MGNYTLIITEKPDAAQRIAQALNNSGKVRRKEDEGIPYFLAERDGKLVVVPGLGHLYTVAEERKGRNHYPAFSFKWVPRHAVERGAKRIRKWIESISRLASNAGAFIDACDYDIEGSIIGYCLLKYACGHKEMFAKRMKYSTLTKEELEKSYGRLLPHLDFDLIEAGRARHELDWIYGVNLSRALTISARNWSGRYATLSTGRVQGPTLKFLVSREKNIKSFVPTPYWKIKAKVEIEGLVFETEFEKKKIEAEKEAFAVLGACEKKNGQIEKIDIRRFKQKPPVPFNSGGLQSEAYRLFGYTPRRTSDIAQRLYLDALISYPRTSSQRLPRVINYRQILVNLTKIAKYRNLAEELLSRSKLKPQEGRKEDPAHPAIYPTGKTPERTLNNPEKKILDLITRRFMAVFGEPATKLIVKAHINVHDHRFFLKGRQTLKKGWLRFYTPYATSEEVILPTIREGQQIKVTRVFLEDKFTRPPSRYNPGSLLRKMEKSGIGTKATRAGIIQTLYDRKYIQGKRMEVTDLGLEVLDVLDKYCPSVVSARMTSRLQIKMDEIQVNREKRQNVLIDAVEMVKPVMTRLKEKEEVIGERLSRAIRISKLEERMVGVCPICRTGNLMILYSRKSKKRFIGCTSYFEGRCNTSFPLPQRGSVRPLKGNCPKCGWPIVQVWLRSKHPWTLCFNSDCPSKKSGRTKR